MFAFISNPMYPLLARLNRDGSLCLLRNAAVYMVVNIINVKLFLIEFLVLLSGPGTVLCDQVCYIFMFLSVATSNLIATSLAQKVLFP